MHLKTYEFEKYSLMKIRELLQISFVELENSYRVYYFVMIVDYAVAVVEDD